MWKQLNGIVELLNIKMPLLCYCSAFMYEKGQGVIQNYAKAHIVMLQIKLDFCGGLISYKLGSVKGGVHVEEA